MSCALKKCCLNFARKLLKLFWKCWSEHVQSKTPVMRPFCSNICEKYGLTPQANIEGKIINWEEAKEIKESFKTYSAFNNRRPIAWDPYACKCEKSLEAVRTIRSDCSETGLFYRTQELRAQMNRVFTLN